MADNPSPVEQPAVKTTIVGGRPPGSGKPVGQAPRGMEVLIKKAAVDPEFRAALLAKRAAAADDIGLTLEPAEALMLNAVPARQLELIINTTKVDPRIRPAFLGKVAAAMLLALGITTMASDAATSPVSAVDPQVAVAPPAPTGVRPDTPPPTTQQIERIKGERPDAPRIVPVAGAMAVPPPPPPPPTTQPTSQPTAEQTGPLAPGEFEQLIARLDDPQYKVREAASNRLLDVGKPLLPRLQQALDAKTLPPEAQWRVADLIKKLNPPATNPPPGDPQMDQIRVIAGAMRRMD